MFKTPLAITAAALTGLISQASFTNTINLGAVLLAMLIVIVTGYFTIRQNISKTQVDLAKQQIEGWKGNYESEKESRELVQAKLDESVTQLREALTVVGNQKAVIERLEALPNLERLVKLMADTSVKHDEGAKMLLEQGVAQIARMVDLHNDQAIERHKQIMAEIRASR